MATVKQILLDYFVPPRGVEVRRLIAALSLAVGLPRMPGVAEYLTVGVLRFGEPEWFGVALTLLGILLLVTSYRWRLKWSGRLVAALSFAAWATLAASTTSVTSLLVDLIVMSSLLAEVWTMRHE